ncbi:MAG: short-chain dehydrogenase [Novosphingobium sp.]|nr:short-chain dehydrogenase [Novosphingobium sp.]
MRMFDLTGQVALVTGSTKGIGRGIAEVLCAQGAIVGVSSRSAADCIAVAGELNQGYGDGSAFAAPADVSDLSSITAMVDAIGLSHGRIDILVCNAARLPKMEPFGAVTSEEFLAHYDTNVEKTLRLVQLVAPGMAQRGGGSVILISSRAGIAATPQHLAYSCAKAAMTHLSRNLAAHYAPQGVRINCLAPGLIRSESSRAFLEAPASQAFIADVPMRRAGEADEVGGAVAFLASAAAGYITGAVIPVDGGVVDLPLPPGNAASLFRP